MTDHKIILFTEAELAQDPDRLGTLAAIYGQAVPDDTSPWTGPELARLAPRIVQVARSVLTEAQLECFARHLLGETTSEIARNLEKDSSTVHRILHGRLDRNNPDKTQLGAIEKVTTALQQDETFQTLASKILEERPLPDLATKVIHWFADIVRKPEYFVERAVLLVFHLIADSKGQLRIDDAYEYLPRAAVGHSLARLRYSGHIQTDGVHITVIRTPVDDLRIATDKE